MAIPEARVTGGYEPHARVLGSKLRSPNVSSSAPQDRGPVHRLLPSNASTRYYKQGCVQRLETQQAWLRVTVERTALTDTEVGELLPTLPRDSSFLCSPGPSQSPRGQENWAWLRSGSPGPPDLLRDFGRTSVWSPTWVNGSCKVLLT